MKACLLNVTRLLVLASAAAIAPLLVSCTTTDADNPDVRIYPTAAEKNQQMQEQISSISRTLM